MAFKEYDCVRVVRPIPASRVDRALSEAAEIQVGDCGAVLMVHVSQHLPTAYLVECVDPRGVARWVANLFEHELELASSHAASPEAQGA